MNTVQKLRMYAILMRLKELQRERTMRQFLPEPLSYEIRRIQPLPIIEMYDKKGKPLPLPKSKYHK